MFETLKQRVVESYVGAIGWLCSAKSCTFREHFHCTRCRLIRNGR